MKLAIHNRPGSFSDRWIEYCKQKGILFKIVNCYESNIISQLKDCNALLWHHHHANYKDVLTAKSILFSLEHAGVKVFPDFRTGWHFDDKVAQKYLLEAIDAPLVPSYVFYDKQEALNWAAQTKYPKVWKLKGGAGSQNVQLVRNKQEARKFIKKAFGRGFSQFNRWGYFKERFQRYKSGNDNLLGVCKGLGRLFIPTEFAKMQSREKGYVYFQEFVPNLDSDIRIQIISDRVFGLKRFVRKGDFRASGSGDFIEFSPENIDLEILKIAIELNKKIKSQSLTIDFIYKNKQPLIVELSYGFPNTFYDNCPGYWDEDLNWHEGQFNPQGWMIDSVIKQIKRSNAI